MVSWKSETLAEASRNAMNLACFAEGLASSKLQTTQLMAAHLMRWVPGQIGVWLRCWIYSSLFKQVGDRLQILSGALFDGVRQIETGCFVQIDCQVKIDASAAALICLQDSVNLRRRVCLVATQQSSIVLAQAVTLNQGAKFRASQASTIEIGQFTQVGAYCLFLSSGSSIKIGDRCHIGDRVMLRANLPDLAEFLPSVQIQPSQRGIVIEEDCWVGNDVTVLEGVTIGTGSVISDAAVLANNVPPYSIVVGAPAKIIEGVLRDY